MMNKIMNLGTYCYEEILHEQTIAEPSKSAEGEEEG